MNGHFSQKKKRVIEVMPDRLLIRNLKDNSVRF